MTAGRTVYLSLGSNLGDRQSNLRRALEKLAAAGLHLQRCSSLYETEPVGFPYQRFFLNCVAELQTTLMPLELLRTTQRIERELGRRPTFRWGPRPIDIDILFYGQSIIRLPELHVPHPRLYARRFVLLPLHELAPELLDPLTGHSIAHLLASTPDRSLVRRWGGA